MEQNKDFSLLYWVYNLEIKLFFIYLVTASPFVQVDWEETLKTGKWSKYKIGMPLLQFLYNVVGRGPYNQFIDSLRRRTLNKNEVNTFKKTPKSSQISLICTHFNNGPRRISINKQKILSETLLHQQEHACLFWYQFWFINSILRSKMLKEIFMLQTCK